MTEFCAVGERRTRLCQAERTKKYKSETLNKKGLGNVSNKETLKK